MIVCRIIIKHHKPPVFNMTIDIHAKNNKCGEKLFSLIFLLFI